MKKFYIETKSIIDHAFTLLPDKTLIQGKKVIIEDKTIYNMLAPSNTTGDYKLLLMSGTLSTKYKLSDLIDIEPVKQGLNRSIILINDVKSYGKVCVLRFPQELVSALKIAEFIKLEELDKSEYANAEKLDNRALLARGIDPIGKTWYCMIIYNLEISKEEWLKICEYTVKVYLGDCVLTNLF